MAKKKKRTEEEALADLMKLTKLVKEKKVQVEAKDVYVRRPNPWRSQDPKFAPKAEKPANLVKVGEMEVDPSLQNEYEQWRKDKEAEQEFRRLESQRRIRAAAERRARAPKDPYF